jgi:hypothetical protein
MAPKSSGYQWTLGKTKLSNLSDESCLVLLKTVTSVFTLSSCSRNVPLYPTALAEIHVLCLWSSDSSIQEECGVLADPVILMLFPSQESKCTHMNHIN